MIEKAKWIWGDFKEEVNQYVDFIMDFSIDDVYEDACFEVSVDKDYAAYINGKFVGCGQFHDYPDKKVYDTYKIKDFLRIGENRLFITGNYQGSPGMQYAKGARAICFAIKNGDNIFTSDKSVLSAKSKAYTSGDVYKITSQLGYGAIIRGTDYAKTIDIAPDTDFGLSVEKDVKTILTKRPVKKLEIYDEKTVKVVAQGTFFRRRDKGTAAEMMQKDFLSSSYFEELFEGNPTLPGEIVSKNHGDDGVYLVLDIGKEESGYLTFDIDTKEGVRIDISFDENLDDLRVRSFVGDRHFAYTYYTKQGRQQFTHYFKRIAGRYIELHVVGTDKFKLYYAGMYPARYPVIEKGHFKCNDRLHNKIYEVSLETLKQCMHEHYEDCPWREQALYSSDSRNQALCGYYVFDNPEFARSSIELLGRGFSKDGYIKICAPTDENLKIPSFSFLWLLELKEYTEYTGDLTLAEQMWDTVEKMLNMQVENMEEGIVATPEGKDYWNFYEWSKGYTGVDIHIRQESDFADGIFQVFLYLGIKAAVNISNQLGKTGFESKYNAVLENMKQAIHDVFFDEKKSFTHHMLKVAGCFILESSCRLWQCIPVFQMEKKQSIYGK